VDVRRSSPTFGEFESFELDDVLHRQLFIPIGFSRTASTFLSEVADVTYKVSIYYQADQERGVAWDDPSLAIPWPTDKPIVSGRDQSLPRLNAIVASLPDW
jgi:dTDP-4-dehydrorhamnose 3,5-epimerase